MAFLAGAAADLIGDVAAPVIGTIDAEFWGQDHLLYDPKPFPIIHLAQQSHGIPLCLEIGPFAVNNTSGAISKLFEE
jgi:hypothetical protein